MLRKAKPSKHVGQWWKRLFSSEQQLPPAVLDLLDAHRAVVVTKFAGQGRGLAAARDLQQGETVLVEPPFVCTPAISHRQKVCYHCLKVLPSQQQGLAAASMPGTIRTKGRAFCGPDCLAAASQAYYTLESQLDLRPLESYCEQTSQRFPLLAARLALTAAQAAMSAAAEASEAGEAGMARSSTGSSRALSSSSWLGRISRSSSSTAAGGGGIGRLSAVSSSSSSGMDTSGAIHGKSRGNGCLADINAGLSMLCFANMPQPPPQPWRESHSLLLDGMRGRGGCREEPGQGAALAATLQQLDLDWHVAVLSRLHLNTFKVDAVLLDLDWSGGQAAAAAAAAALLGGSGSSGSALYLLASLFNHSCEPNVNVNFPRNDATLVLTAARDIAAGEQLFISYIDAEQEVSTRQEFLAFSYGFRCRCPRCTEELADAAAHAPPQL